MCHQDIDSGAYDLKEIIHFAHRLLQTMLSDMDCV